MTSSSLESFPAGAVDDTLMVRLRHATRASHERAERFVGLPTSLEAHRTTLAGFFGFLEPWERAMTEVFTSLAPDLGERRKTQWLMDDLRALGLDRDQIEALPRCDRLPPMDSQAAALGSMYVFEGATLGGQILSRHIEQNLGLGDGSGYSFYRSYGTRVGEQWRAFGRFVNDRVSPSDHALAIAAARETFDRLNEWFEARAR